MPEGISGPWVIERFPIKLQPDIRNDPRPCWAKPAPGIYTRLRRETHTYMTDLPEEWWHHLPAMRQASRSGGQVLFSGLGLGLVVDWILGDPKTPVESVTILESDRDVINLVAGHLQARHGNRIEILHADAFEWLPPKRAHYAVVWHDIWPNAYDMANEPEMDRLEKRFAPYCDWQGCWARGVAESHCNRHVET